MTSWVQSSQRMTWPPSAAVRQRKQIVLAVRLAAGGFRRRPRPRGGLGEAAPWRFFAEPVIDLGTAEALALTVSDKLLALADEVIE
jgi:hypothetical protein